MRISAKADYGVRAAVALARADERIASAAIASQADIPAKFLEGILTTLVRAELVESRRGANGGYALRRPPETITVADVIRAVDGPLVFVRDQRPSQIAEAGALVQLWVALRANVRLVLEGTTLADLAAEQLPPEIVALTNIPGAWENP